MAKPALRKIILSLFIILPCFIPTSLLLIQTAFCQDEFTGNKYLKWSKERQCGYLFGYYHGIRMSLEVESINPNKDKCLTIIEISPLEKTIRDMDGEQFNDVFLKYLNDYPEKRHYPLAYLVYGCLNETAIKLGYKQKKVQP